MKLKVRSIFLIFVLVLLAFMAAIFDGCKKPEEETTAVFETSTVTDVEGTVYKTIKIGDQWWMTENLRVTKYRNGNYLQSITDSSGWSTITTGAYCLYDNKSDNLSVYGRLYNWFAISDTNGLAPTGWHIPTDAEWKTLEEYLGMTQPEANKTGWRGTNEGEKLKIEGNIGWSPYEDVWATNESGFTALAGSCRLANADFGQPGLFATGFWWSSSEFQNSEAWYRYLDYKNKNVFRSHESKSYGFSVRCVKN